MKADDDRHEGHKSCKTERLTAILYKNCLETQIYSIQANSFRFAEHFMFNL